MRIPARQVAYLRRYAPVATTSGTANAYYPAAPAAPIPFRCYGWSHVKADDATSGVPVLYAELFIPEKVIHADTGIELPPIAAKDLILLPEVGSPTSEQQRVTITGTPTGGFFTLTVPGVGTTANIAVSGLTNVTIQTALNNLLGAGSVIVTAVGSVFTVTFQGAYAGMNVGQMTATPSFTGGTAPAIAVATLVEGDPAITEVLWTYNIQGYRRQQNNGLTGWRPGSIVELLRT